jgi:predicted membrane protein
MDPRDSKNDFAQKLRDQIHEDIHERIHQRFERVQNRFDDRVKRPTVMLLGDVHWGFAWGVIIVLVGVCLLLYNAGVIPFNPLARYWPVLLILFGVMNLMTHSGRFFGFLLILAGAFLQLNKLGLTHLTFADLWPVALIALGLLLMWGSLETRGFIRAKKRVFNDFREQVAGAVGGVSSGVADPPPGALNAVAIFGGCERRLSTKNFRGGKATAVLGGIELDFRDADIGSENGEAVLEINCVLGGVEIRVPENWHVYSRTVPVLGGYEDTSRQAGDTAGVRPKTLVITGMVVLGGVEIKN